MNKNERSDAIEEACKNGALEKLAEEYIIFCQKSRYESEELERKEKENDRDSKKTKKKSSRFPNVAGFCRYFGIGQGKFDRLAKKYPDEFEKVSAALEDEALNAEISPSLLGVYLKRRLGYAESAEAEKSDVEVGQLKLVFEHDIISDGE